MNRKLIVALALIAITVIAVALLFSPQMLAPQTILSISGPLYVDPQGGYEVAGEFRGAFWNMLVAVNQIDDLAGVVGIPKNQSTTITWQGVQEILRTGAKIEIKIDPQPAYLLRTLVEKFVTVTPEVGRTYQSKLNPIDNGEKINEAKAGSRTLNYYDWAEPTFRIYCPFTVSVYKDGALVGQKTFNTEGASSVQIINTAEGAIRIENLGILQGIYMSPNVPAQICILKGYPYAYDLTQVQNLISYDKGAVVYPAYGTSGIKLHKIMEGTSNAYSLYWYGQWYRWANSHPAAFVEGSAFYGYGYGLPVINPVNFGGWTSADDLLTYKRDPVKPVIDSTEKGQLPADKRNFMSLTEYIASRGVQNLANTIFAKYSSSSIIWETVSGTARLALKLDVPWGGFATYGVPLINIRVPTELADTWIDRPPISNVKVSLKWEESGTKTVDIADRQKLIATLTQHSKVASTTEVSIQCANNRVGLYPLTTRVSLAPNEIKEVYFDVSNLGKEEQENNVPITVVCRDTYTYTETSRDTAFANLLATLTPGETFLYVKAVEKGTSTPIMGLQLQVIFATETLSGFTGSNGRWNAKLELPSGGAWVGKVLIQSEETFRFRPCYYTVDVDIGINEVVLQVEVKGEEYPEYPELIIDWWLILIIAVAALVVIIIIYAVWKHRQTA